MTRGQRVAAIVTAVAFVLLIALGSSARFYTDVLWFEEVGFTSVLWKTLSTQALIGLVVGAVVALLIWFNLWLPSRLVPAYTVLTSDRASPITRYRDEIMGFSRWIRIGIATFAGIVGGFAASGAWRTYLLWANREPFGIRDPQFGRDVGFYVFELPFYSRLLSWVTVVLVFSLIAAAAGHFFYGAISPERGLRGITGGALAHLSGLLGLFALGRAGRYYLDRFELNFSPRGQVTGASYTDVHAQLPALMILTAVAVIAGVVFLANVRLRRVVLPVAVVGVWIVVSILAGGMWPWAVQRFSVEPQELQRERPYLARNIAATRAAFGIDDVRDVAFPATTDLTARDIEANEEILQNVRVWDPDVLERAYQQLQAIRLYYQFTDVDVDRYEIDGELRQVLLSPRELFLDGLPERSVTWPNLHLGYTHGFGIVASLANESTEAGQPQFLVKNVPGRVLPEAESLDVQQPRLYYSQSFDDADYSVVDSRQAEIDFPTDQGVERIRYDGAGGVPLGGIFNQIMFATREGDPNLVLSDLISGESRILLYRNVRDRVLRIAPFLNLDYDPYIAAVDGRLVWIIDAYTSTAFYPYAERFDVATLVSRDEPGTLSGVRNYIRNSVKVVVDAYDGTVSLHIVDPDDPLISAWADAFPELFATEQPSPQTVAHFRYPEDLFEVQSDVYATYHMTDPANFYQREDEWSVAQLASQDESVPSGDVPPTYLLFELPTEQEQEFVITRAFTPRLKDNLNALLVGRSDGANYGELVTLQLPRQEFVAGPKQINRFINQDVEISRTLTLLRQEGSQVIFGSLVVLPIEESFLYIQPLFVAAADLGIPELKRVVVVFGEEVVMEENFDAAIARLFDAPDAPRPDEPPQDDAQPQGPIGETRELIEQAARLYDRAQRALRDGDLEAYARFIERLGQVIEELESS